MSRIKDLIMRDIEGGGTGKLSELRPPVKSPAPDLVAQYESFRFGWDAYTAREPISRCQNEQQRAGWLSALNAEAVASLPASCASHLGF